MYYYVLTQLYYILYCFPTEYNEISIFQVKIKKAQYNKKKKKIDKLKF